MSKKMKKSKQKKRAKRAIKKFTRNINKVCVFCGASPQVPPVFLDMAYGVGKRLAKNDYTVVYGGGNSGLMGSTANGALEHGGEVIGIFPDILKGREAEHLGLSVLVQTKTMHERKLQMYDRSDAFVILPGGLGTMDEFFEIATWRKLGGHTKPIIVYDFMGYWERLLKLIQSMIRHGFMAADTSSIFLVAKTEDELFDLLKNN